MKAESDGTPNEKQMAALTSEVASIDAEVDQRLLRLKSVVYRAKVLQKTVDEYVKLWNQADGEITRTAIRADAKRTIYNMLKEDVWQEVVATKAGQPDGFDVDTTDASKDPRKQRVAVATALLMGCRLDGREFGVIAGGFYLERAGADRLLREWPGVTHVDYKLGIPDFTSRRGEAFVQCTLSFQHYGKPMEIKYEQTEAGDFRLACRVNAGQMTDAIHGKCKRKLAHRALEILSGIPDVGGRNDQEDVRVVQEDVFDSIPAQPADDVIDVDDFPNAATPEAIREEQDSNRDLMIEELQSIDLDRPTAREIIEKLMEQVNAMKDTGDLSPAGYAEIKDLATKSFKAAKAAN